MISKIICRNCKKKKVQRIFDLGKLYFTGKFPPFKNYHLNIIILGLSFCVNCKLIQLNKSDFKGKIIKKFAHDKLV